MLATVTIAASPERVFRAITEPGEIIRWWRSDELYRTTNHTADLRPGGAWRSEGKGSDGTPFTVEGEFTVVEPPHRLSMTWKPAWDGGNVTTVNYLLEPIEGGTRLTLRHEGFGERKFLPRSWHGLAAGAWMARCLPRRRRGVGKAQVLPDAAYSAPPRFPAHDECRGSGGDGKAHSLLPEPSRVRPGRRLRSVADPDGVWGLGVVKAADEGAAMAITDADPVIRSGLGLRYEVTPMIRAMM